MYSCKKEKLNHVISENTELTNSNKSIKFNNSPKNINGILRFESIDHLQNYYQTIDELVEKGHDENLSVDSLLKEVEGGMNFLSFRQDFINKYDWEDKEFTEEEIGEISKRDFIIDEVRKSILNEFLEVGVGEFIYIYYSENQVYKIPDSKISIIENFRNIDKGDDSKLVPKEILGFGIELISQKITFSDTVFNHKDAINETMYPHTFTEEFECNTYDRKITTRLYRKYVDNNNQTHTDIPHEAESIIIDFGDGTTETFYDTDEVVNTHTYPTVGTFDLTITFSYLDSDGNLNSRYDITSTTIGRSCTSNNYSQEGTQSNSSKKIEFKGWIKHDIFGEHMGSYSHAYKWKASKSKWKRNKDNLYSRLEGSFGTSACNIMESIAKSKTKYGKKLSSKKHKLFKDYEFGNGDIKTFHSLGGSIFYNTLILNPCD